MNENENVSAEQTAETSEAETKVNKSEYDSAEVRKLKAMLSKANSQIADYKRAEKERMTAEERAEAERLEQIQQLQDELAAEKKINAEHNRKNAINDQAISLTDMGFDAASAKKLAEAMVDGDVNAMSKYLKAFTEAVKQQAIQKEMNSIPKPGNSSDSGTVMTKEKLQAMPESRRYDWIINHQDEYQELYKK